MSWIAAIQANNNPDEDVSAVFVTNVWNWNRTHLLVLIHVLYFECQRLSAFGLVLHGLLRDYDPIRSKNKTKTDCDLI